MRRSVVALILAALAAAPPLSAQGVPRGFELERLGRHTEAAALYLAVLSTAPADEGALLGLERVLPRLARTSELLAAARRARAAAPRSTVARAVELRALAELGDATGLDAAAEAWIAEEPASEEPWREWALALADRGALEDARRVLAAARRALGRADALATVAAEVTQRGGDWAAAAGEWRVAVAADPTQQTNATYHLGEAPLDQRDGVLAALTEGRGPPIGRQIAADLLVTWGRPLDGWRVLQPALAAPADVAAVLRAFVLRTDGLTDADARRARGLALAAYADVVPPALAARARAEAARALLDAGDRAGARAQLARLVDAADISPDARALAEAALIDVLIRDGALDEAAARLRDAGDRRLNAEDAQSLRLDLARAYIARGELDAAESGLGADSSVAAAALRGWIALYDGDLATADSQFRLAGPYAGPRDDATARTAMLALLQTIDVERAPDLGRALLRLARNDSAGAVTALRDVARRLGAPSAAGILTLAGRVAARPGGDPEAALRLLTDAVNADEGGAFAPEAELVAARVLLRLGRTADAVTRLEHLILTYPGSAFTPDARRELARARGTVPRS
jgi:tetratricopeptide (TPR) repeat protein